MKKLLSNYFYWTYARGSLHYDVMVTLILAFIFVTPHLWDYGDKPSVASGTSQPMQVTADGGHGLIITVQASDVDVSLPAADGAVRKALRKAVEPVAGDSVFVEKWELTRDANGNPAAWKIWAHR